MDVQAKRELKDYVASAADIVVAAELRFIQTNIALTKSKLRAFEQVLNRLTIDFQSQLAEETQHKDNLFFDKEEGYRELDFLKERLSRAFSDKSSAYSDLASAKSEVNSWHSRSKRSFFGNAGKPLPKHSLFGQSFGDLDAAKARRSSAVSDIADSKREIGRLKNAQRECYDRIQDIKEEIGRSMQRERAIQSKIREQSNLFQAGYTVKGLKKDISMLEADLVSYERDLVSLNSKKETILSQLAYQADAASE